MTPFEQEVERQRQRLLRIERNGATDMLRTYRVIHGRLTGRLRQLTSRIDAARAAGEAVSVSWLHRQAHYQALIVQVEAETRGFAARAVRIIESGQSEALIYAPKDARDLAVRSLGTAPAEAVAEVDTRWSKLPDDELRRLVGNASDGTPLGDLLADIAPRAVRDVSDVLAYGVAAGQNPRVIAREFQRVSGQTLTRSLRIARTETLGAYRQAHLDTYRLNQDVVRGWTWWATVDRRTCASCWAQHGTEHGLAEPLSSHPQCRCTMVPRTASWGELGFQVPDGRPVIASGEELFARLSPVDQLAVLGPAKLEAYQAGLIALGDLVEHTHHPRWGAGSREGSLARALERARAREQVAA